ncbi:family 43 glycosylhydrolase [Chitinophaga agrisoli]|nr:family 43 glycosylhydrolase [Chitinophaga agrisoli]
MRMRIVHSWLILLLLAAIPSAAQTNTAAAAVNQGGKGASPAVPPAYSNPVIPGDFPDPSVIKVGDTYYATGTSSEWAPHYPLFTSKDLVHWKQLGYIFSKKPEWTTASFWAPELYYYKDKFYVYYTARNQQKVSYIGVAVTDDPAKGFTDKGPLITMGTEDIDAFVFKDDDGLYITWKAYGLDKRPIELLGSRLSADGLSLQGEPFSLLKDTARKGMEGQSIVKRNGYYYLLYSAGGCCGVPCDYNVRVARSKSLKGPYELNPANPILHGNTSWMCTGHGTPVKVDDKRWFYLYHAYNVKDNVYTGRQGMLDELFWDKTSGWPYFKHDNSPSAGDAATPEWRDDFERATLSFNWQWNFRAYTPDAKLNGGKLYLSGNAIKPNTSGTALCLRPLRASYEISTEVANINAALKGLVIYGDDKATAGIGVKDKQVLLWKETDGKREELPGITLSDAAPVQLKIKVVDGWQLQCSYRTGNGAWQQLPQAGSDANFLDGRFLKQWDRSPRPGLLQQGGANEAACFSWFSIKYE